MQKKGSIELSKKGLLDIADDLNSIISEQNNSHTEASLSDNKSYEGSSSVHTESIPTQEIDSGLKSAEKKDEEEIIHPLESTSSSKLLSYESWKQVSKFPSNGGLEKPQMYDHELVSFSNWRQTTEERYDCIKKSAQAVLPDLLVTQSEHVDEEDLEEIIPLEAIEEAVLTEERDIVSGYTIEDLGELLKASTKIEVQDLNSVNDIRFDKSMKDSKTVIDTKGNLLKAQQLYAKKRKIHTVLADISIVAFCLVGIYFSLYTFFQSLNQSLDKVNAEPIATISYKYKSAQRKLSDRVLWDRIKQDSPVYNGDIIRTATGSEATVTFFDGNKINLQEQTLAQFYYNEEGASIDFSGGEIAIEASDSGAGIQLSSGEASIKIEAGTSLSASVQTEIIEGTLVAREDASVSLQVTNGVARLLSSSNAEENVLLEGDSLVVDNDGEPLGEPSIIVQLPETNAKYLRSSGDSLPVAFNWTVSSTVGSEYALELSKTKDFSIIYDSKNVTGLDSLSLNLSDGMWYWRIYSENPGAGKAGKFRIIEAQETSLITPNNNERFTYALEPPAIRFLWEGDVSAASWLFEVSNSKDMSNPIISQISTQPSRILTTLDEGAWYWRVTPTYPKGVFIDSRLESVSSTIGSFTVERTIESTPVKLVSPANKEVVDRTFNQYFSWEHDRESDFYTILFSRNSDMSSPVSEINTESSFYVLTADNPTLEDGLWYWAVLKTDLAGGTSLSEEVRNFLAIGDNYTQELISPKENDIIFETDIEDIVFSWNSNVPLDTYIQISRDALFESVDYESNEKNLSATNISLPAGKWYWRIVSKDENSGFEMVSKTNTFFVEHSLADVMILQPREDSTHVLDPSLRMLFVWEKIENAQHYELEIFNSNNSTTPVYENMNVVGTSLDVDMNMFPQGSFFYTIRAVMTDTFSEIIQKSAVAESRFNTRRIVPITLSSPRSGITIDGVSALLDPPTVRWSSSEKVISSEFILSRSDRGLSADSRKAGVRPTPSQVVLSLESPGTTINLPELSEGTWYWTVTGKTEGGFDITAKQPMQIIVKPIENLPSVEAKSPKKDAIFDIAYFSSHNYIDFSWEPLEGAEEYVFTLKDSQERIVIKENIGKETTIRFTDLEALDRGTFIWSIEASRKLPSDVVQQSDIFEQSFIIDLPQVSIPQNTTSGDLYGL